MSRKPRASQLAEFALRKTSLDEVFLALTGRPAEHQEPAADSPRDGRDAGRGRGRPPGEPAREPEGSRR